MGYLFFYDRVNDESLALPSVPVNVVQEVVTQTLSQTSHGRARVCVQIQKNEPYLYLSGI